MRIGVSTIFDLMSDTPLVTTELVMVAVEIQTSVGALEENECTSYGLDEKMLTLLLSDCGYISTL